MKKNNLNQSYWEKRYHDNNTPWNIGSVSTPIKTYIDQLYNKELKILVPGAGNAYEAEYLWNAGFKNVYVVDIAEQPLKNFSLRYPEFPADQLIQQDFFKLEGKFDLIFEQTFFCSLPPDYRNSYAMKMDSLLHRYGKLVGLLFNFPLDESGPPFGGNITIYRELFSKYFKISTLEKAYNSIEPRENKELFFIFDKP